MQSVPQLFHQTLLGLYRAVRLVWSSAPSWTAASAHAPGTGEAAASGHPSSDEADSRLSEPARLLPNPHFGDPGRPRRPAHCSKPHRLQHRQLAPVLPGLRYHPGHNSTPSLLISTWRAARTPATTAHPTDSVKRPLPAGAHRQRTGPVGPELNLLGRRGLAPSNLQLAHRSRVLCLIRQQKAETDGQKREAK